MREPFYNQNQFRDFPFLQRATPLRSNWSGDDEFESVSLSEGEDWLALPRELVVDCGLILGPDADYSEADGHFVWLHSLTRSGNSLWIELRTNAPGAGATVLRFHRDVTTAGEFAVEWAEAIDLTDPLRPSESLDSLSEAQADDPCTCGNEPIWEGYLATGLFTAALELLGVDDTVVFPVGLWTVEPALVRSARKTVLRSISLANYARTVATDPCESVSAADDPDAIFVAARCLTGPLAFREGYNCAIRQEDQRNAIVIGAAVGGGRGLPCGEVPRYPAETSPDGGSLLTGGPSCGEIIQHINGLTGPNVPVLGGNGVTVVADPDTHRLSIVLAPGTGFRVDSGSTGGGGLGGGTGSSSSGGGGTGGSGGGGGGGGGDGCELC